ncbi:BTAD domain-containing putative transcriptional regulator [Planobispora siamensis]|uniref:SARP family transcriptional regulator n=1 Tax=Planobispora siamensis TaxID=936338 RepID=A0A8J3WRN7_9ACTN|nr:BTAD domain-containing putative transcriptional regulator [Planobispora siamensis]GIH97066.1 SARP family transcriptional regulator [Planobispora siamensis]
MQVLFGVLGPVTAWDADGEPVALKGPRHRAVLARLIVARGRVVPVTRLVDDLWTDPPPGALGAVRTFVAALRRALEPRRPPRTPARLLITEGPGYALRAEPAAVDAWRFERAVTTCPQPPAQALARLEEALGWWRGPAYAEFTEEDWARAERSRLAELRLHAVELRAQAHLALGRAAEAVADLDAHVTGHPWREEAWRLLALALYRTGRQADALAVLRRARTLLVEHLGVDPGPELRRLESDILQHAEHLRPTERPHPAGHLHPADRPHPGEHPHPAGHPGSAERSGGRAGETAAETAAERVWAQAAAAYDRTVASGARARLESTVGLLRNLAVTGGGGLEAARLHRVAAIAAAEELGDAELTARVIGAYDVPAIWTRSDDPKQAAHVVAAAERALAALPPGGNLAARARLLATIALESRGTGHARARRAARQAEEIARGLDDPTLLAFALNGAYMQAFGRTGLAPHRDEIGAELVELSARHGLVTFEVLGHLIRMQARSALADFAGADRHAAAADRLAERHELPLAGVFTLWYRALRLDATGDAPLIEVEAAYRRAAALLEGAGMPGLEQGLLPLTLLCLRQRRIPPASPPSIGKPADETTDGLTDGLTDGPADELRGENDEIGESGDRSSGGWGPYEPWARPLVLLTGGRRDRAAAALRRTPEPPAGLLMEALWCLTARAALALGDRPAMRRARTALAPAAAELAGAGSGLLTVGPVCDHLDALDAALGRSR